MGWVAVMLTVGTDIGIGVEPLPVIGLTPEPLPVIGVIGTRPVLVVSKLVVSTFLFLPDPRVIEIEYCITPDGGQVFSKISSGCNWMIQADPKGTLISSLQVRDGPCTEKTIGPVVLMVSFANLYSAV